MLSMIAAGAMLLQHAAPAAAPPTDDIVVIGERMRRIRVHTMRDKASGEWRCRVRRSGGDPALDTAVCNASIDCAVVETTQPGMQRCMAARLPAVAQRFARPAAVP